MLRYYFTKTLFLHCKDVLKNIIFISQAKNTVFESAGYDGGHRKSLIPPVTFEVRKFL